MSLLNQTLDLCKMYSIKPDKSKGQNFLINESVYDLIVDSAEIKKDDTILEVGPGLGFLTFKLAKLAKKVLSVELDSAIVDFLKVSIISKGMENIRIFNNDILKLKSEKISKLGDYKIVSNLPYNISSVFLRKFLSTENKPELIVLLLQKELVERIVSKPHNSSLLSLSVQFYAEAEIIGYVDSSDFYPSPKVNSAIIKIKTKKDKFFKTYEEEKSFFRLLKFSFSAKRKMLKNNLSTNLNISQEEVESLLMDLGLNPKCRAESLSLDNYLKLYSLLFNKK